MTLVRIGASGNYVTVRDGTIRHVSSGHLNGFFFASLSSGLFLVPIEGQESSRC